MGIVVDDLAAATKFFVGLGLKVLGEGPVEGGWVDRVLGLEGVRTSQLCGWWVCHFMARRSSRRR